MTAPIDELAALRLAFAEGLSDRHATMDAALTRLAGGWTRPEGERLYFAAHSLEGTAAAYGAEELVAPAVSLAGRGRRWLHEGNVTPEELDAARLDLQALRHAIDQYRARLGTA